MPRGQPFCIPQLPQLHLSLNVPSNASPKALLPNSSRVASTARTHVLVNNNTTQKRQTLTLEATQDLESASVNCTLYPAVQVGVNFPNRLIAFDGHPLLMITKGKHVLCIKTLRLQRRGIESEKVDLPRLRVLNLCAVCSMMRWRESIVEGSRALKCQQLVGAHQRPLEGRYPEG